jgi:hypothetical protein
MAEGCSCHEGEAQHKGRGHVQRPTKSGLAPGHFAEYTAVPRDVTTDRHTFNTSSFLATSR